MTDDAARKALADLLDERAKVFEYVHQIGFGDSHAHDAKMMREAAAALRSQPAMPREDREQIAAILYMTRFPHRTWITASLDETTLAYKQADAILTLVSRPHRGEET
jgi:hypothetical protein